VYFFGFFFINYVYEILTGSQLPLFFFL
jgi:hypothetical protein